MPCCGRATRHRPRTISDPRPAGPARPSFRYVGGGTGATGCRARGGAGGHRCRLRAGVDQVMNKRLAQVEASLGRELESKGETR